MKLLPKSIYAVTAAAAIAAAFAQPAETSPALARLSHFLAGLLDGGR